MIASPLHALTGCKVIFQWGNKQKKYFDTLKQKIVTAPILAFPDLQQPFKIETDASGYEMGSFFLQKWKPICFHSENFLR